MFELGFVQDLARPKNIPNIGQQQLFRPLQSLFQFVKETHDAKFSNTNTGRGDEFDSIIEFWQGNSKSEQFILQSFWIDQFHQIATNRVESR